MIFWRMKCDILFAMKLWFILYYLYVGKTRCYIYRVFSPLLELWGFYEVVELLWWCCWCLYMLICIYVVGELSYMLLVLNCWCKHVMNNVGVDYRSCVNTCIVVDWVICSCIITCCRIHCIQLFGLIIQVVYDVQLASGVTTSEVIWYHMHIGVVSTRIA